MLELGLTLTLIALALGAWLVYRLLLDRGRLLLRLEALEQGLANGETVSAEGHPTAAPQPDPRSALVPALLSAIRAFWSATDPEDARYLICRESEDRERWAAEDPAWQAEWREAVVLGVPRGASGKRVLEVGCGVGRLLKLLAPEAEQVVGVDVDLGMIRHGRDYLQNVGNAALYLTDGVTLPFRDGEFDLVYSVLCLQHQPSLGLVRAMLAEMTRVTRQGGYLRIQTRDNLALRRDWRPGEPITGDGWYLTSAELVAELAGLGLEVTNVGTGLLHPEWVWATARRPALAGPLTAPLGRSAAPVGEGPYALYHVLQDMAIQFASPYPAERFSGAGIVIVAGGPRYFTNAWVCLTMLRRVLGCRLPIQVWYLGPAEMSPRMIELLSPFDVECVDALEVRRDHPTRTVGGWECKPFAILHSPFKEVILLDADNVPLVDPAVFLSSAEYRRTGAIFWPDLVRRGGEHSIWEICRVPYRDEPELESGQIVVDKERCWAALQLTAHLNDWSDFYHRHLDGDKGTFQMAWWMLDVAYSIPPHPPEQVSGRISPDDLDTADVLLQHDFDGRVVFQHRTGAKWTAWGENLRVPGFQYEERCLEALDELRRRWDGRVDPPPTSAVGAEAEIVRARYFIYRRVGTGDRVLALQPGGRIGDGRSRWEQMWRVETDGAESVLVIEGYDEETCRLTRDPDGVWRGRWLGYERLPIEVIALDSLELDRSGALRTPGAG